MKKELRPDHESVRCEVCGRTILKGERTESFLAPGGRRHAVCELCFARAEHHGWIREGASGELPSRVPRAEPRRPLLGRLLRPSRRSGRPAHAHSSANGADASAEGLALGDDGAAPAEADLAQAPPRRWRRDPRHVRAVPTTAEVKVERAIGLFNGSEHQRTVAGLVRTLGRPWVSALPDFDQPSAVTVVVAWELSWYRFRIDLGDEADPVVLLEKGDELEQIDEPLRDWNASVDDDGRLVAETGGGLRR